MSLQHLPTEVIQKIAGYCEVTDISYLSRTCRVIHEAVEDPAVFRESVFHAVCHPDLLAMHIHHKLLDQLGIEQLGAK